MIKSMKNKLPQFSVLMTVYNKEQAEYLDSALNSIEKQTVSPKEIVLVEDGILNRKLEKIIELHVNKSKSTYKIIKSNNNRGRGLASQLGLDHISTDWVARVDSDDVCYRDRFKLQLEAISNSPDVKMVGGQITEFQGNPKNITGKRLVPLNFDKIKKFSKYRSPINNPTIMFSKRALDTIGGYPALNVMEDYDLCIKFLINDFKVINLPDYLVNMRVNNQMYKRRGGLQYLLQYTFLKWKWYKMGVGTITSVIFSVILMASNVILPVSIRKLVYSSLLREK